MGLNITFYKTKDTLNKVTPVVYIDGVYSVGEYEKKEKNGAISFDEFEKKSSAIYEFRNNYSILTILRLLGGKNDSLVVINEDDLSLFDSNCVPNSYTIKEYDDFITTLKRALKNNTLVAHISY